ncbi:hypothetical protein VCRA217O134_220057 [Vibrio crassostreae]|nr:hypothetical protein VCRA217O134_220057 [Vibrio crassostreae]
MFYIVGIRSRLLLEAVQQGREHPKSFLPHYLVDLLLIHILFMGFALLKVIH